MKRGNPDFSRDGEFDPQTCSRTASPMILCGKAVRGQTRLPSAYGGGIHLPSSEGRSHRTHIKQAGANKNKKNE